MMCAAVFQKGHALGLDPRDHAQAKAKARVIPIEARVRKSGAADVRYALTEEQEGTPPKVRVGTYSGLGDHPMGPPPASVPARCAIGNFEVRQERQQPNIGVHAIERDDRGQSLAGFREQIVYLMVVLLGHDNVGPPGTCFGI
jgi:hypothetical protein